MDIPQDIIDSVIAAVGDDKRLLKQCALVSSSFLLPSRKQLFSRINLRSDQTCQGIYQFLVQNPVIQSFVRTITLTGIPMLADWSFERTNPSDWMNGTSLLGILRLPFCCLECFSIIVCRDDWDWDSFSSEMKDTLSNTIMHSSLKTLSLTDITKVPINFFLHDVHLTTLELYSIAPNDFGGESSIPVIQEASEGVASVAMAVDRCVWRFWAEHWDDGWYEIPFICLFFTNSGQKRSHWNPSTTFSMFLPFMRHLRLLEIYIDFGPATWNDFDVLMYSLEISLATPATLEHLELNVRFRGAIDDFDFNIFYEDLREGGGDIDAWSHLDSIATHPAASRLQRVDINVIYAFRCEEDKAEPDEDKVVKALLDGLPLLRTKGILFVKAVVGVRTLGGSQPRFDLDTRL